MSVSSVTLRVGESTFLSALLEDTKGGLALCSSATWSTSNSNVATLVGGTVRAVANGTTYVKVTSGTAADSTLVTVATPPVASISVVAPSSLLIGQTARIEHNTTTGACRSGRIWHYLLAASD